MKLALAALMFAIATPALSADPASLGGAAPGTPAAAGPPARIPAAPTRAPGYGKTEGVIPGMVFGPKLSLVSVPTPSIGLEVKLLENRVGLSFDYDLMPSVDVFDVEVGYTDWNLGAKWYPWQRSFFVGASFGSRSFKASATEDTTGTPLKASVSTKYLAPEIGWRWVWDSGFFMGMDLGYQIVLSSDTTFDFGGFSTSGEAEDVREAADDLGKIGLPIVTLLQVGWFF